jgi:hypothetical protein
MTVHVEQLTTEVLTLGEDFPLSQEQVELIAQLVIKRLSQMEREARNSSESTALRASAMPTSMSSNAG